MPMSARTAPTTITLGKYFWGLGASLLALLIGAWLMVAPFALGYQPYGDSWTGATTNDFWLGLAVVVVSLVGLALFAGSLLVALRGMGATARSTSGRPPPGSPRCWCGRSPTSPPGGSCESRDLAGDLRPAAHLRRRPLDHHLALRPGAPARGRRLDARDGQQRRRRRPADRRFAPRGLPLPGTR